MSQVSELAQQFADLFSSQTVKTYKNSGKHVPPEGMQEINKISKIPKWYNTVPTVTRTVSELLEIVFKASTIAIQEENDSYTTNSKTLDDNIRQVNSKNIMLKEQISKDPTNVQLKKMLVEQESIYSSTMKRKSNLTKIHEDVIREHKSVFNTGKRILTALLDYSSSKHLYDQMCLVMKSNAFVKEQSLRKNNTEPVNKSNTEFITNIAIASSKPTVTNNTISVNENNSSTDVIEDDGWTKIGGYVPMHLRNSNANKKKKNLYDDDDYVPPVRGNINASSLGNAYVPSHLRSNGGQGRENRESRNKFVTDIQASNVNKSVTESKAPKVVSVNVNDQQLFPTFATDENIKKPVNAWGKKGVDIILTTSTKEPVKLAVILNPKSINNKESNSEELWSNSLETVNAIELTDELFAKTNSNVSTYKYGKKTLIVTEPSEEDLQRYANDAHIEKEKIWRNMVYKWMEDGVPLGDNVTNEDYIAYAKRSYCDSPLPTIDYEELNYHTYASTDNYSEYDSDQEENFQDYAKFDSDIVA